MGVDSRDRKRRVEDMNSTQKQFSLNRGASIKIPKSKYLKFKNLLAPLSLGVLIASTAHSTAASITVTNHSFEFNTSANTATDQLGVPENSGGAPASWKIVSSGGANAFLDNRWYNTSRHRMAGPTHGVGPNAPGGPYPPDVVDSATSLFLRIGGANTSGSVKSTTVSQDLGTVTNVFGADSIVRLSWHARFGACFGGGNASEAAEQADQTNTVTITVGGVAYATWTSSLGSLAQGRTLLKWDELGHAWLPVRPNPFTPTSVDFSTVGPANMTNLTLELSKAAIPQEFWGQQLGISFNMTDMGTISGTAPDATVAIDNVRMETLVTEPPPALIITQTSYDANNDQLTLTWISTLGATYTIENATQFVGNGAGTSWDNLTTGIPSGGTTTTKVIDAPSPGTYYRIRKE